MDDGKNTPSFERQVLARAWFGAWAFFESWRRDIGVFVFSLVVGGWAFWKVHGWHAAWSDAMDVLIHVAAPAVILWLLLFVWHVWLAPSAIVYEELRKAQTAAPIEKAGSGQKPTNWGIWRQMDFWTIKQFSAILARDDPALTKMGTEQSAFFRLIIADVKANKLPHIKEMVQSVWGNQGTYERPIDVDTKIRKADAIRWAKAHDGFDTSHVD